jgi:hypothetical protein
MESCTSQATCWPRDCASAHGIDGEQRRLGLDVMHVLRIIDGGIAHRGFDRLRDLLHHRRPADVLRQELGAHRGSDRQARLRCRAALAVLGEDGRVRGDDAVAAARPHHRDGGNLPFAALAVPLQRAAQPPLPSVLPMTAITSSAVNCPRAMHASSPEASCTVLSSTFATSIAIRP